MWWLIAAVILVLFFYLVGRSGQSGDAKKSGVQLTVRPGEGTVVHNDPGEKPSYLPSGERAFRYTHDFQLFGTAAMLGWTPGDGDVEVWCISSFSKGLPKTQVWRLFRYNLENDYWEEPPKGAARECQAEIRRVVKR